MKNDKKKQKNKVVYKEITWKFCQVQNKKANE